MNQDDLGRGRWLDYGKRGLRAGWSTMGDFQKFLLRGNVVDLAVGVVIGAAFNGLVQAFVTDFIQPLIRNAGGISTFNKYALGGFQIGPFFGVLLSFVITAAVVYFFVVKPINILQDRYNHLTHKDLQTPTTRECPFCLSTVPLKASRCAYCTSQLPAADDPSLAAVPLR